MNTSETDSIFGPVLFSIISNVIIGLAGQIGSLLVIIVIVRSKPLRTPCFQLIAGGAIGSYMVALHYFIARLVEGLTQLKYINATRSGLECLLGFTFGLFGLPYHGVVTCLVGLDRLISLVTPIKYRTLGKRYVFYGIFTTAMLIIIQEVIGFATAALSINVNCIYSSLPLHASFLTVFSNLNLFYCTANLVMYAVMLFCFYKKNRQYKVGTPDYNTFTKNQSAAMPTVKLMILLYFICGILPEIFYNIGVQVDKSGNSIFTRSGNFLKACSSLVEFLSLSLRSEKFRDGMRLLFKLKTNTVGSLSGNGV